MNFVFNYTQKPFKGIFQIFIQGIKLGNISKLEGGCLFGNYLLIS